MYMNSPSTRGGQAGELAPSEAKKSKIAFFGPWIRNEGVPHTRQQEVGPKPPTAEKGLKKFG